MSDPLDSNLGRAPDAPPRLPPMPGLRKRARPRHQSADALRATAARWGEACARRWASLDRRWRYRAVCSAVALSLLSLVFSIGGPSRKPGDETRNVKGTPTSGKAASKVGKPEREGDDSFTLEAYQIHRKFVCRSFQNAGLLWGEPLEFSPQTETRIVRKGNLFRIRGRVRDLDPEKKGRQWPWIDYTCEIKYDPELDVWEKAGPVVRVD